MMNQYDVKITGKDLKRFLRNLHQSKIQFYHIQHLKGSIIVRVNQNDYDKIKEIKTIYEVETVRLYGPIRVISFIKMYRFFFLFLGIGLILIYFLSHLVFNVTVVHNKKEIRDLIIDELKLEGISKYHFVVPFKRQEKIVSNIIHKYREKLEWMEIERVGVSYIIKVEERKIKDIDTNQEPRDIIAKKDGRVVKIDASQGSVLVVPGQYVKKGDILISGEIKNKEILMAKVRSNGRIFAETWYDVTVELPYHYSEEKETGNSKQVLTITFFGKKINLFDFSPYKNKKVKQDFTISNRMLPLSISWNKESEIEKFEQIYTKDKAIFEANNLARKKLATKIGTDDKILYEKSLKITEEDSKIVIVIFFKVKEDITDYQDIKEEMPQTEEGS